MTSPPPVGPLHSPAPTPDERIGELVDRGGVDGTINVERVDGASADTLIFPVAVFEKLEELLSRQRWVVPVLPGEELDVLIGAAHKLCEKRLEEKDEACRKFLRYSLQVCFARLMNDEAVKEWKRETLCCIYKLAERALDLCVAKLDDPFPPTMEILALLFHAKNKYHSVSQHCEPESVNEWMPPERLYALPPNNGPPKGRLVDLLNRFGRLGGFNKIRDRFRPEAELNCVIICAFLKPFGHCYEFLHDVTVEDYFREPILRAQRYLLDVSDEELKRETKGDARESNPVEIVRYLRNLSTRLPGHENVVRDLELLRLKIILRTLQVASFAGKMNALNEMSKILQSVGHKLSPSDEYLNVQQVVSWIRENDLLNVAIKENLHLTQYVEKLEKLLRFMINHNALSTSDLDQLWAAQSGKHDAIVKNIHDLLAKVALDFTAEQMDHLFGCFQRSWTDAGKKQRVKLLELIQRLAEDDRDGRCADKVLQLLWNFARSEDIPTDIMDQALRSHEKILDYSYSTKEHQKIMWLGRCVEEIRRDKWVLPAMKHFRAICVQFQGESRKNSGSWSNSDKNSRVRVVRDLQDTHSLVALIAHSLVQYMQLIRRMIREHGESNLSAPSPAFRIDGHYDHSVQVHERLSFLKFVLRDGKLWLCEKQAKDIWDTLVVDAIFPVDREAGFKWFVKMMDDVSDLDPEIQRLFYEQRVLQLDPSLLTESGMRCFERFFKLINLQDRRLTADDHQRCRVNNFDLIGQEYLWRVILLCNEDIANTAIELVREIYTSPSAFMVETGKLVQLHTDFIQNCINRLQAFYDTSTVFCGEKDSSNLVRQETTRMTRLLRVLHAYIVSYDEQCVDERVKIPLRRASLGQTINALVSFTDSRVKRQSSGIQPLEILTHANQTLGGLKRQILRQVRIPAGFTAPPIHNGDASSEPTRLHIELKLNGTSLDAADDRKLLDEIGLYGRLELQANLRMGGRRGRRGSSPGSSSEDSSPGITNYDSMDIGKFEKLLPGTWLCQNHDQIDFLLRIADLGAKLDSPYLRDWSRAVLDAIPGDVALIKKITELTEQQAPATGTSKQLPSTTASFLQNVFFASSPSEVLYSLELIYAMLSPARDFDAEKTLAFQVNFVKAGGIQACLSTLLQNNFMFQTDGATKAMAFWYLLRLLRLLLSVVIRARCAAYSPALQNEQPTNEEARATQVQCEYMTAFFDVMPIRLDTLCYRLCVAWAENLDSITILPEGNYPELDHARMIMKLAWAAAGCNILSCVSPDDVHLSSIRKLDLDFPNQFLSRDAVEVFVLCAILNPSIMESLLKEKFLQNAIIDLVFCPSEFVRIPAGELFYSLATKTFCIQPRNLHFFLTLLRTVLFTLTAEKSRLCREYFVLLRDLLIFAKTERTTLQQVNALLDKEIAWLKEAKNYSVTNMAPYPNDTQLEGHLMVTRALVGFLQPDQKYHIGSAPNGPMLVKELLEEFLLPSSRMYVQQSSETTLRSSTTTDSTPDSAVHPGGNAVMPRSMTAVCSPARCVPVCALAYTIAAAYELIVALCTNCVPNMQTIYRLISEMYFDDILSAAHNWEYAPPVNLRTSSFVGLKNGGATCYMNSVFQQLFMIEKLRNSILSAASPNYCLDDSDNEEAVVQGPVLRGSPPPLSDKEQSESCSSVSTTGKAPADGKKEYNMGILQCAQLIFANLLGSQLQFYVPQKFWKLFRFGNELINLREQHDAAEFFNSLVDSVDEALKALGEEQICNKVFGGTFANQIICKGCPHRYTREESFTTLSLDVRNHHNMIDSLHEYVKGDLLESENAYLCEKCNRKVEAVKRLCVKKLPPILVIQLKRFDFDWEREQSVKFNDYFEFPREVDMEPYTVEGLAKLDGEVVPNEKDNDEKGNELPQENVSNRYKLRGIIVHSGQAAGGHYYSFILHRQPNGQLKWYKFDDGEVTDCQMDEDEEMRSQCFGGEYTNDDHYARRYQQRRHKRWWNAYILFYERIDGNSVSSLVAPLESMKLSSYARQLPAALENIVYRKNMEFCHKRSQYTPEFFRFIRQIASCHFVLYQSRDVPVEDSNFQSLLLLSTQIVSKFLFTTGLRARRNLRGNPQDWIDIMNWLFRLCPSGRIWFASEILFKDPRRFVEYMLESPSPEVRLIFARSLLYLTHYGSLDGAESVSTAQNRICNPGESLSALLIRTVLSLLQKEALNYGRHLKEYFGFFYDYMCLGSDEKLQLMTFNVPSLFIRVILDEGPGPSVKNSSLDLQKLYVTLCQMIRSCDVSSAVLDGISIGASSDGSMLKPNPWQESPVMPLPADLVQRLYGAQRKPMGKLFSDAIHLEDVVKLVKFLCWENILFTKAAFALLFEEARFTFTDLVPLLACWLQVLLLEDSWAEQRVILTLQGGETSLLQYIQSQYPVNPRRAYLFTKMLITLLEKAPVAVAVLYSNDDMKRRWNDIAQSLYDQLNLPPSFNVPHTVSNEVASGTYLERTNSAKITLHKAIHIVENYPKTEEADTGTGDDVPSVDVSVDTDGDAIGADSAADVER